tara:strand:- start:145 stop:630 length:486 start_codon:yes stop_codon:yes gene_type:complete
MQVFDNFFSKDLHKNVWHKLRESEKWILSYRGLWHLNHLEDDSFFSDELLKQIHKKLPHLKNYEFRRIYANGQTACQVGNPHTDDGNLTFLYYPNLEWQVEYQGHLSFFDERDELKNVVEFRPNRAVLFPAHKKHWGQAPDRSLPKGMIRISLAYKFDVPH